MSQSTSKQATSTVSGKVKSDTSNIPRSDESVCSPEYMRSKFESLLDDCSSDEESILPDTSDSDIAKKKAIDARQSQRRSESENSHDEVILAMMWAKGHLGAAYYNVTTSELFVMEDILDSSSYNITKTVFRQSQPRYVILKTGMAEDFLNVVKKLIITDSLTQDDSTSTSSACTSAGASLHVMTKNEYNYENCYHRVLCLKLNCEPPNATSSERMTFLTSFLNFKSRLMVHSLGLLLKYVDANWNRLTLNPTGHAEYLHISYIVLQDLVMIDDHTYDVLDIVKAKFHPSLFKFGNSSNKEHSLSLFTLLNRCQSRPGVLHLWKLLKHPTKNKAVLYKRYEAIKFFLDQNNQNIVGALKRHLGKVHRLPASILNHYRAMRANVSEWMTLHKTLTHVLHIGNTITSLGHPNSISIFEKIIESITSNMHVVQYFLDYIIDFELSKIQGKVIVKAGVDPELDELNNMRQKLPQLLTEMGEKDMKKYSQIIESCVMVYLPDICFVLAVTESTASDEELAAAGMEFKFTVNGLRHYKSDGARELDDTVGDVLLKITKRQTQIILRLVKFLSKHVGSILKSIEYCAELDALLSLAIVAQDHNYVMPELVESKKIIIQRGRHPLKELLVNIVPNDTYSSDETSLVKILTGPNACGKSVYLKQIALIVFMAHIGSFVPADSAIIGIVSHIFTQVHSNGSLGQNASSFLLDLRQINVALHASTPNSLVIFDEFGTGTCEIDGLALLTSVLQTFVERGVDCPHLFVATHIHRVVELLPRSSMIEAQSFEFLSNEGSDLVFLYRLVSGKTTSSFAHSVAKSAGLSAGIVDRALEIFEAKKRGILPTALANRSHVNTIAHIMELLSDPSGKIDLENIKSFIKQAMVKRTFE